MATVPEENELDLREQLARIRRMDVENAKALEEIVKTRAEVWKITSEARYLPRTFTFQAMIATAALLGAGAAIAKLLFP